MKVLLVAINAKYIHSNLAVYSLKEYASRYIDADIVIKEYTINQEEEYILRDIYEENADVIAFSCYIWNIGYVCDIVNNLHKLKATSHILLGGPEASYRSEELLNILPVELIFIGEGEQSFTEYLCAFKGAEGELSMEDYSSLCQTATKYGINSNGKPVDMDELPFVYEKNHDEAFSNRILYYETMRGCPFNCSYCLSSIDKKVRYKSLDKVYAELDYFLKHKVKQVKFVDRTFNCSEQHAFGIWKYLMDNDNGITNFHFEIAADLMTDKLLSLTDSMRKGLIQLEVGVQSTNPDTIRAINRVMDFEKVRIIAERIMRGNNIHLHLDLIAGLPGEDYLSFAKSFNDVYSIHPHELQLGFLKVLRGTEIEKMEKTGHIVASNMPPYEVLYTDSISYSDICRLKSVCTVLDIFYNSNQFMYSLKYLEECFSDAFSMYSSIAGFYEKNGYNANDSSRIKKYEILYDYAIARNSEGKDGYTIDIDTLKECLIMDMNLRDNPKKLPDFASSGADSYSLALRDFYQKEEREHKYLSGYEGYDYKQLMRMTRVEVFDRLFNERSVILYDYSVRDPITGNVRTCDITDSIVNYIGN